MSKNMKRMYCIDCAMLLGLSTLLFCIVSYVLYNLNHIPNELSLRAGIVLSGLLALVFALSAMVTVMVHLHKNSEELYEDSMEMQEIDLQVGSIEGETI